MPAELVTIDAQDPDPLVVARGAALLAADRLVAFPTETVYGLGGHALHPAALAAIFAAKRRPTGHPLIAHVASIDQARALASAWPPAAQRLAEAFWPGPLTLVLARAPQVPAELSGGRATVAVRVPATPLARALIAALGAPIAAPSANPFQALSPTTAQHVLQGLGERVDLVLDGGPCRLGLESTVVDLSAEVPRVLRPGALSLARLRALLPELGVAGALRDEADRLSPGQDVLHYAPHARLLVRPRGEAVLEARAFGARCGLILRGGAPGVGRPVEVRVLPGDPEGYGRELYAVLHALDALELPVIFAEAPPAAEAWLAVTDRLQRARRG